jgi:hypothetical protein
MSNHRNPRPRLSKRATPDNRRPALPPPPPAPALEPEPDELDGLMYTLRDNLRRADAFISTAERQIEENWHDDDESDDESDVEAEFDTVLRHRMRIEYLVEAGKNAVRAALFTTEQIDAEIARRRSA